jgi:hypothetical protein
MTQGLICLENHLRLLNSIISSLTGFIKDVSIQEDDDEKKSFLETKFLLLSVLRHLKVTLELVKAFEELTGQSCDLYQTHLWRYSKLGTPSEQNCVSDLSVRLGLCGDWLRNSTVEGAWLSGYSMARSLIETKEA